MNPMLGSTLKGGSSGLSFRTDVSLDPVLGGRAAADNTIAHLTISAFIQFHLLLLKHSNVNVKSC